MNPVDTRLGRKTIKTPVFPMNKPLRQSLLDSKAFENDPAAFIGKTLFDLHNVIHSLDAIASVEKTAALIQLDINQIEQASIALHHVWRKIYAGSGLSRDHEAGKQIVREARH